MEMQQFHYDNKIVKNFLLASMVWGIVGMLVGLLLAFLFLFPNLTDSDAVMANLPLFHAFGFTVT